MKKSAAANVRAVAAKVVDAVVNGGQSLDAAIANNETKVSNQDRSLLRMLCYGCLRHHWQLQDWIENLISRPLRKRDRVIAALLAVGLFQITQTRIPDHAVVAETVAAARQLGRPKFAALVNACLRRFVRENHAASDPGNEQARWNHPAWLIDAVRQDWPQDWSAILAANNERAPMWLRVNSGRISVVQFLRRLQESNTDAESIAGIADAVRLRQPQAISDIPGFANGDVSVQDAAAQIAAGWLLQGLLSGGDTIRVLDACAAPGGKSGHLLEMGGDAISLFAVDKDEARVTAIAENLQRLDLSATIIVADASKAEEWWDGAPFDGILLDAPCSASGVIRRHPDIKLLRRASDLASLVACQQSLLQALWPMLASGGTLLYATCSILTVENDEVIAQFLRDHSDARENDVLPNNNIRDLMRRRECGYQILPGTAGLDGFYYAALQKKKVS